MSKGTLLVTPVDDLQQWRQQDRFDQQTEQATVAKEELVLKQDYAIQLNHQGTAI